MSAQLRTLAILALLILSGCESASEDAYKSLAEIASTQRRPAGASGP